MARGDLDNESIKRAQAYAKALENSKKMYDAMQDSVGKLSSGLLGLSENAFFDRIAKSPEEMRAINTEVKRLRGSVKQAGTDMKDAIVDKLSEGGDAAGELRRRLDSLSDIDIDKALKAKLLKQLDEGGIKAVKLNKLIRDYGDEGLKILDKTGLLTDEVQEQVVIHGDLAANISLQNKELEETHKTVLSLKKAALEFAENMLKPFSPAAIKDSVLAFDTAIKEAQRSSGIAFAANSEQMAVLVGHTAKFGFNIEAASKFMVGLGETLATTNFEALAEAAEHVAAIEKATGVSSENVQTLAGEWMLMGRSAKRLETFSGEVMKDAAMFGISGKKAMEGMASNMQKMRLMGFIGGEESLKRMVLHATRLRLDMDEVFNMADKARNIEGALEMAAELQLAAGSFAAINPMDLLAAARKGPDELVDLLSTMGGDVGSWVTDMEGNEKYQFDPVDRDRLKIVEDATGQSLDSLEKMIMKKAEDARKISIMPGVFSDLDPTEKAWLLSQMTKDKNGQWTVEGIDDLTSLTGTQVKNLAEAAKLKEEEITKRATDNIALTDSLSNLKNTLMSVFAQLEPYIVSFTEWINKFLIGMSDTSRTLLAWGAAIGVLLFSPVKWALAGTVHGLAFSKASAIGRFASGGAGGVASALPRSPLGAAGAGGVGGFLTSLSTGIKSFGSISAPALAKFAISVAIIGGAITGLVAVSGKLGGDWNQLGMMGAALLGLGTSLFLMSKITKGIDMGSILKGSLAMGVISIALLPFALALQMLNDVSWTSVLASLAFMALATIGIMALGALLTGPQFLAVVVGAGAIALVGASIALFGVSMLIASKGFEAMAKIDWASFAGMGAALMSVAPGLIAFSIAGLAFANPIGLLGFALMITQLGLLAVVMNKLADPLESAGVSMTKVAEGIGKIKTSLKGMDTGALKELKNIGVGTAATLALISTTKAIVDSVSGGGTGGNIPKYTLEVIVKTEDGRELQRRIVRDTELLSG